ncbi:CBS domain-containing protein [Streptomyces sp. TRM 70361]|uniref:CBS domain-containing protein n=1 Tax=Streptomyces sp. TRM 70361 TaxID=3116553 RepID=UPI002E7B9BB1|nr:CBS domain-containing protein [Streptomyces sp. TRM 70361]MEE1941276.1 CBS domain-containing protein [Streptomyces sp. TRM 70361]
MDTTDGTHGTHGTPYIVSDVMTHTVVAIGRGAPFKQIVATLEQWRISALPVLEGEGRVVGVVSEADLLPKEEYRGAQPSRLEALRRPAELARVGAVTAGELMTSPAVCVHARATLAEAARIMARGRVKRLPVVDLQGLLVGVVSRGDLLKVFLRPDEDIAAEVRRKALDPLFPAEAGEDGPVAVSVVDGVVVFGGRIRDTSLVPVAARLARAVEGVVDVTFDLDRPAAADRHLPPVVGPMS